MPPTPQAYRGDGPGSDGAERRSVRCCSPYLPGMVPSHVRTASGGSSAPHSRTTGTPPNHQIVIEADTRLVVVVGQPLPGNRNDCKAWEESGAKAAIGRTLTIADSGYPGTGLVAKDGSNGPASSQSSSGTRRFDRSAPTTGIMAHEHQVT